MDPTHDHARADASRLLRPSPDVVARRLDQSGVLVHLTTNQVFELNDTGMRIWELLIEGVASTAVADRLVAEFTVTADQARREVADVLAQLEAAGLVR